MPIICLSFIIYGIEMAAKKLIMLFGTNEDHYIVFLLSLCYEQLWYAYHLPITIKCMATIIQTRQNR